MEEFNAIFSTTLNLRQDTHNKASNNITKAQKRPPVPPDEKPGNQCVQTESNKWIQLPGEIVKMILVLASKGSVVTFNTLKEESFAGRKFRGF